MTYLCKRWSAVSAAIVVYFILFPEDLSAVVTPLERVLAVSSSVSIGLYVVIGVAIISWTMIRIWSRRLDSAGHRRTELTPSSSL